MAFDKSQSTYKKEPSENFDGTQEEWDDLHYDMQYYYYNKEKRDKGNKKRKEGKKDWVNSIKANRGCTICEEDEPVALDFHHYSEYEKQNEVGELLAKGYGKGRMAEEMESCMVLCANCHRKVTKNVIDEPEEENTIELTEEEKI